MKRAAVLAYGAEITTCDNTPEARAATLAEVVARTGATEIHPFDDDRVIAGAGTAALELMEEIPDLDVVVAPVGGGGLLSGTALATHGMRPATRVIARRTVAGRRRGPLVGHGRAAAAAPAHDDRRRPADRPVGAHVRDHPRARRNDRHRHRAEIVDAMQTVWLYTKQLIEPSAAVAVAAVSSTRSPGARVGVILSGGNVDLDPMFATLRCDAAES